MFEFYHLKAIFAILHLILIIHLPPVGVKCIKQLTLLIFLSRHIFYPLKDSSQIFQFF